MELFRRERPIQESHIELPFVVVEINHTLKVAFMHVNDNNIDPSDYAFLEQHLLKRGYFLQVFVPQQLTAADLRPDLHPPEVNNANS